MRSKSLLAATALLASGLAFGTPAAQAAPTSAQALPECKPLVPAKLIMRRRTTV